MNNTVRNEAQRYGIGAILVAIAVLLVFFFLSKSGVGSSGATATGATDSAPAVTAPSPAAT